MKILSKPLYLFLIFLLLVFLHNMTYAIFNFEEPVFVLLSLVFLAASVISLLYKAYQSIKK